jgi:hypothetical protein
MKSVLVSIFWWIVIWSLLLTVGLSNGPYNIKDGRLLIAFAHWQKVVFPPLCFVAAICSYIPIWVIAKTVFKPNEDTAWNYHFIGFMIMFLLNVLLSVEMILFLEDQGYGEMFRGVTD